MQGSILPVTIPPRAHPRGFAIFFLLGGLFATPGHAERDNSPPVQKHNQTFWQELKESLLNEGYYIVLKNMDTTLKKKLKNWHSAGE